MPMEELFDRLECSERGLATNEAQSRGIIFGLNKLEEKKVGLI
jgi:hypothetical protein